TGVPDASDRTRSAVGSWTASTTCRGWSSTLTAPPRSGTGGRLPRLTTFSRRSPTKLKSIPTGSIGQPTPDLAICSSKASFAPLDSDPRPRRGRVHCINGGAPARGATPPQHPTRDRGRGRRERRSDVGDPHGTPGEDPRARTGAKHLRPRV